ncbi:glyoxalase [Sphaerisporangium krabiense]|uniref:Catechol 2,3-dioxygenase-like lactoylglutathione lyase family enzyme n=1 Tax=Sphaerisporangium krabiense TaxID=763782 RepID=A0A7W9DTC8_9ACTN|nr:VOC family protein [Sphaerisporangium krabiense]MBB5630054.1 catechol 2,3-dioxygenase-like lactoylglutathione lyase family enzyme [Sphaerisporangium krabiense]GII65002.1 glyoxalase [Sphaerisporangium krabiense]
MSEIARMYGVVLDCPDPQALAAFYSAVLGWKVVDDRPDWVSIDGGGDYKLSFQRAEDFRAPVWPSSDHPQQMHLDLVVDDREKSGAQVVALGAVEHSHQPGRDFTVYLDPAGHPFCLCDD